MKLSVSRVLAVYQRILRFGGLTLAALVLAGDLRWIAHPIGTAVLVGAVLILRATPIRLSKYSYLTQTGLAALAGAVVVGPASVVLALIVGVVVSDTVWLRKGLLAGLVNAGREVIAFIAAFGVYALVLRLSGGTGLSLDFLPAAFTLAGLYFLTSRALFYFALLLRSKLENAEQLLILRWEVVSYLVTIIGAVVAVGAVHSLAPAGWVAVVLVLAVLGMLTRKILEEAIAAEDLNKVHLMELAIVSNVTLQASLEQIERLAYRLLDWGDFRIYRANGDGTALLYRGETGRTGRREPSPDLEPIRAEVMREKRMVMIRSTLHHPAITRPEPDVQSILIYPLRFGEDVLGTVEVDHFKRNAYGGKDATALATLAAQIATAIHIAELRRPLVSTVDEIGAQVAALARAAESLRTSAAALTGASRTIAGSVAEQGAIVTGSLEATTSLVMVSIDMAAEGSGAAEASAQASETAGRNRAVVGDAIDRLVQVKAFVADSSRQVQALGDVGRRIAGFIGSIREIADLTNLIALNAAIEAARAGQEGKGFAVVADEIRELAAQSMSAAREAGALATDVTTQVDAVLGQMRVGEGVVAGVEQLSGAAARAFDAIVGATEEAGMKARRVAEMAATQELSFEMLTGQINRIAEVSATLGSDTMALGSQAGDAARGQEDLERAIGELSRVAADLQTIARHFTVGG